MSSEAITARLQEMARLSREAPPCRVVDMSSEAITARLQEMAALSALCFHLQAAGEQAEGAAGRGEPCPTPEARASQA
ncbi:MAG: hypothetical protein MUF64_18590 [Polyangiaceae bacterium]|jgi:hypothetical protein|nr:hypothetical protein [Polyangiaceae bacterium]